MRRLFLGIAVPDGIKINMSLGVGPLQTLYPTWKFVKPENYHVTLSFLGEIDEGVLTTILPTISQIASTTAPFTLNFQELTLAPAPSPRMIWAISENQQFTDLVTTIESSLSTHLTLPDYRRSANPIPHITLARFDPADSQEKIQLPGIYLKFLVTTLHLFESHQTTNGPEYTLLEEFSLSA